MRIDRERHVGIMKPGLAPNRGNHFLRIGAGMAGHRAEDFLAQGDDPLGRLLLAGGFQKLVDIGKIICYFRIGRAHAGDPDGQSIERRPYFIEIKHLLDRGRGHSRAPVFLDIDQTIFTQNAQRPPRDRTSHTKFAAQTRFPQPFARLQIIVLYPFTQRTGDRICDRNAAQGHRLGDLRSAEPARSVIFRLVHPAIPKDACPLAQENTQQ